MNRDLQENFLLTVVVIVLVFAAGDKDWENNYCSSCQLNGVALEIPLETLIIILLAKGPISCAATAILAATSFCNCGKTTGIACGSQQQRASSLSSPQKFRVAKRLPGGIGIARYPGETIALWGGALPLAALKLQ